MTESKIKNGLSILLLSGIFLAFLFVLSGGILYLLQQGTNPLPYQQFHQPPKTKLDILALLHTAFHLKPFSLIFLGFLILVLTQILRVLILAFYFLWSAEYLMAIASFFIFILLVYAGSANALEGSNKQKNDFTFSGYIEPSYNYLSQSNHFVSGKRDRSFDLEPQGFTLQQAAITLAKEPEHGFGGLLNLILGRDANTLSPAGINPDYFGIQNIGLTPTQAYLQYQSGPFKIFGGKYNTPIGYEAYDPTMNTIFSQAELGTFAQPNTYIGIAGQYTISPILTVLMDINNGWDTIEYTSRQKTLEINAVYKPFSQVTLKATAISGIQPSTDKASSGPTGRRSALDLIATLKATSKLSFAANYDYGTQNKATLPNLQMGSANWQGLAAYLIYRYNDKWSGTLRGELFSDADGYRTGVQQTLKELTLTATYSLLKCLIIRAETRRDVSNVKSFLTSNGQAANNNLQSFALEGLYLF